MFAVLARHGHSVNDVMNTYNMAMIRLFYRAAIKRDFTEYQMQAVTARAAQAQEKHFKKIMRKLEPASIFRDQGGNNDSDDQQTALALTNHLMRTAAKA